jgi:hypothetical protein
MHLIYDIFAKHHEDIADDRTEAKTKPIAEASDAYEREILLNKPFCGDLKAETVLP